MARTKLDRAITTHQQEFSRKYPSRAGEIDKKYCQNVPTTDYYRLDCYRPNIRRRRRNDVESKQCLPRDNEMATEIKILLEKALKDLLEQQQKERLVLQKELESLRQENALILEQYEIISSQLANLNNTLNRLRNL